MIDKQAFISELNTRFSSNGLASLLNMERCERFYSLTVHMLEENEKYNLTAIKDPEKIILGHYVDCCAASAFLKKNARIADIGCGAGFPSLPLAIVRDDISITAIDSTAKRVNYVDQTAKMLGLTNVTAVTMRAEDGGKDPEYREQFDYATARAVAELRILAELCLPYVKTGGQFIAMKGKNAEFELQNAKKAIALLGGRNTTVKEISLKGKDEVLSHPLILIDKKEKTPKNYPRPFAQISKKPL